MQCKNDYEVLVNVISSDYDSQTHNGKCYLVGLDSATLYPTSEDSPLQLNKYQKESLERIYNSLSDMEYYLDGIRVVSSTVCFDTIDGRYILMYSMDGVSPKTKCFSSMEVDDYVVKKIDDNWYQCFKKRHDL